jgi:low affinity Fe/Cu permease
MEHSSLQRRISRIIQWVGDITSRSGAAAIVAAVMIGFLVLLAIAGFPVRWQTGFATTAESITLVMLFVIQHTQNRQQVALQLKLDELIRTSPHADDLLVHIEVADDSELIEREQGQIAHHEALRDNESGPSSDDESDSKS